MVYILDVKLCTETIKMFSNLNVDNANDDKGTGETAPKMIFQIPHDVWHKQNHRRCGRGDALLPESVTVAACCSSSGYFPSSVTF